VLKPFSRPIPIADPIVMRVHPSKRDAPASARLQLLAWKRPDTQEWSIPGGILLDGEDDKEAVLRILSNRLGNMAANSLARLLGDEADISDNIFYRGYSDDPRNTDNAWTEVRASI
jgi:ADP-ribose pyrophosphatase YjhB (NUDIX family)